MNLGKIFSQIHVEPGVENAGATLDTFFARDPQLCEALPDRLRGLIDLADLASIEISRRPPPAEKIAAPATAAKKTTTRKTAAKNAAPKTTAPSTTTHPEYAPGSRIVQAIWKHALRTSKGSWHDYDEVVRVNENTGALDINLWNKPLGLSWYNHPIARSEAVTVSSIDRFDAILESGQPAPRSVTAALMLAADVCFAQSSSTLDNAPSGITGYEYLFVRSDYSVPTDMAPSRTGRASTAKAPDDGMVYRLELPWPLPPGYMLPFYAGFSFAWKDEIKHLKSPRGEVVEIGQATVDEVAKRFLRVAVHLLQSKAVRSVEYPELDWSALALGVKRILDHGGVRSNRWAFGRAGLLAAPEYGLSKDGANAWLEALRRSMDGGRWKQLGEKLREERRSRVEFAGGSSRERIVQEIDEANPGYHWARLIEGTTKP